MSKDLPIAVYFVGAEGTGKTTLARLTDAMLRRNGFKLKSMIAEVARAVQARREMDIAAMRTKVSEVNSYQREVFRRQYASERKRGFTGYVADRSLIDNLCYQAEYGTALADLLDAERAALEDYLPRLRASVVFHVTPQRIIYESSKQVDMRSVPELSREYGAFDLDQRPPLPVGGQPPWTRCRPPPRRCGATRAASRYPQSAGSCGA